jgi:hypothetical protein
MSRYQNVSILNNDSLNVCYKVFWHTKTYFGLNNFFLFCKLVFNLVVLEIMLTLYTKFTLNSATLGFYLRDISHFKQYYNQKGIQCRR